MKTLLFRAAFAFLAGAAWSCLAGDNYSDNHVTKTESGFARALSGFFNALNEDLERQRRDQQGSSSSLATREEVTVEIQGDHGWVPIHLERRGSGFVGPRGEYYSSLPERSELERTYGRTPSTYSGGSNRVAQEADTRVEREDGAVTVYQPNRSPLRIRTEGSLVKEWRVNPSDGSISVLSHSPGREAVAQNFSLRDGRQRNRVALSDISKGKPAWAADFERTEVGQISQPMVAIRVTDPVRDGKVKGPRVTVAGNSPERSVRVYVWDSRNNRVIQRDVPTQNDYWNTQVSLERGRYRVRAESASGRDHEEFWFEVR